MTSFNGRVALVTGASRGIGAAVAQRLAAEGATVVLSSRRQEDLDKVAEAINRDGRGTAAAVAAHAGRPEDIEQLVATVVDRFGHIDVLVNNAATNPHFGGMLDADLGAWDKTFEVNLRGVFVLTKAVVEASMNRRGGSIVNVASVGGIRPAFGLGIYNVTKAALIMFTQQLAKEIGGRGIRVNAVAPGVIKTRFAQVLWQTPEIHDRVVHANPMGRIGVPEEVANAVAFLASDEASYINGEVLVIDGGGGDVA